MPPAPPVAAANDIAFPTPLDVAVLFAAAGPPVALARKYKPPFVARRPPVALADDNAAPEPPDVAVLLALAKAPRRRRG